MYCTEKDREMCNTLLILGNNLHPTSLFFVGQVKSSDSLLCSFQSVEGSTVLHEVPLPFLGRWYVSG